MSFEQPTQEQEPRNSSLAEKVKLLKEKALYGRRFNELKTNVIDKALGALGVYAFASRGTEVDSNEDLERRFNEGKEEALEALKEYEEFLQEHPELESEQDKKDIEEAKNDLNPENWEEK